MKVYYDGLAPTRSHDSDAAFDLRSVERVGINPGSHKLINCGFAIAIPEYHVGLICSRSGLALKHGVFVLNAPGVIDPGYRGDVAVILKNLGPMDFRINPGDRIAQLLIVPIAEAILVNSKNRLAAPTDRGKDGFGSTGVGPECKRLDPTPGQKCGCGDSACALNIPATLSDPFEDEPRNAPQKLIRPDDPFATP